MAAMAAIEKWDKPQDDMNFDDLFGSLYEKESNFFGYTKAIYKTDEIKISVDQIKELQTQLKENVWYQYFSDHVKDVKTWIDFEEKIAQALEIVCNFLMVIESYSKQNNSFNDFIKSKIEANNNTYYLIQKNIRILELFTLLEVKYKKTGVDFSPQIVRFFDDWNTSSQKLSTNFLLVRKGFSEYTYTKVTSFLHKSLLEFSREFNNYLKRIESLQSINNVIKIPALEAVERVYSFNYTSTYKRLYTFDLQSYFLHGKIGDQSKIVLGVSDLDNQILQKFNLWGFTKYHQKLLLDTDYNFIDEYLVKSKLMKEHVNLTRDFWLSRTANTEAGSVKYIEQKIQETLQNNNLNLHFYIWGHSLDVSDNNYIQELFSFNELYNQNVKVTIYYFNDQAHADLLANLMRILGKVKVETWRKQEWLEFKKNPDIAEINSIKPVDLLIK